MKFFNVFLFILGVSFSSCEVSFVCECTDYRENMATGELKEVNQSEDVVYQKKGAEVNWSDERFKDKSQRSCQKLAKDNTGNNSVAINNGDAYRSVRKCDFK